MNYIKPLTHINHFEYDAIVSIGNKCPTTMVLRDLNIYREAYPFDYVPTTPKLILKYLKNSEDFFPERYCIRTKDDVWFGHFNIYDRYDITISNFKRRFERLLNILKEKKKILFCYTTEADLYNEMGNRYTNAMEDLINLKDYIIQTYNYDDFTILAVHVNKSFEDTKHIINYTINVEDKHLSDNMETNVGDTFGPYRNVLTELMKEIFTAS